MANTKNNKRKRESRMRIERAFMDLLQDNDPERVSVTELCRRAGINRSTFYSSYDDVRALAYSIRNDLEAQFADLYREEREQGFNSNDYLPLFRHIKQNQLLYRLYFKLGYDRDVRIARYDRRQAEEHFGNEMIPYHMEFFRAGINAIIKIWLEGGCAETPEQMVEVIRSEYRGREAPSR